MSGSRDQILVVGAGMAGLACAVHLSRAGRQVQVLEAARHVGGRVATELKDGFLVDRGFQVLLTAYPEARRMLDLEALELGRFQAGALVRRRGRFHHLSDPFRQPDRTLATLAAPVATLGDKLRMLRLRASSQRGSLGELLRRPESSTLEALQAKGFSPRVVDCFFRPFLGGIFLEPELATSSRMLDFVFRMFSQGDAALPALGMGALGAQLASRLPPESIRLEAPVRAAGSGHVELVTGERLEAQAVVLAAGPAATARLAGEGAPAMAPPVTHLAYAAERAPLDDPILVLNGDGEGPINNLCVPSRVAPSYAPAGAHLVSVTVLGEDARPQLEEDVRNQLAAWFGLAARGWKHLDTAVLREPLPAFVPPTRPGARAPAHGDGLFRCGDHLETPSLQGALVSGRRAAEAILAL